MKMKKKGIKTKRMKKLIFARAKKATVFLKSNLRLNYLRMKRMGRRVLRSKRIRRYAKVAKIYACESGKKTIQVAKEVKEKTVSFVSKKTSEMWRSLDTEFLFRCATTILILLFEFVRDESREKPRGEEWFESTRGVRFGRVFIGEV